MTPAKPMSDTDFRLQLMKFMELNDEVSVSVIADHALDLAKRYHESQQVPVSDEDIQESVDSVEAHLAMAFEIHGTNRFDSDEPLRCSWRYLKRELEELTRLRAAQQWQDMSTAPKDGTWFTAWFSNAELPTELHWCKDRWEDCDMSEGGQGVYVDDFKWMPLPTPPAKEIEQ